MSVVPDRPGVLMCIVVYCGCPDNTFDVTGVLEDQCNGYGCLYVSTIGIQNGSPDGLAIVDSTGSVVQFLSYEGEPMQSWSWYSMLELVFDVSDIGATPGVRRQRPFTGAIPGGSTASRCRVGRFFVGPLHQAIDTRVVETTPCARHPY